MAAHFAGRDDGLVTIAPVLERYGDFGNYTGSADNQTDEYNSSRRSETTGRPLSSDYWLEKL